ncbi:MAG: hypothetical protein ALAOOOJD_00087 [bacterium]|nr:hypothetical protein [bacterium]
MSNDKNNFIADGWEFFKSNWLIVTILLVAFGIAYAGFIRDTLDDQYREKLRYSSYNQIQPTRAMKAGAVFPQIDVNGIQPGKRTEVLLHIKNVGKQTMPSFHLELKKFSSEVELLDNTCEFPAIPPDSTAMAKDPIVFTVDSSYSSPYVSFFGKVDDIVTSNVAGDLLSPLFAPDDPITVILPVNLGDLDLAYFVGVSSCWQAVKQSSGNSDSLCLELNLYNNTDQPGNHIWMQVTPLILVLRDQQNLVGTTSTTTMPGSPDSVGCGSIPVKDFFKPPKKCIFLLPNLAGKEILCAYFDVSVYDNKIKKNQITLAIYPVKKAGVQSPA